MFNSRINFASLIVLVFVLLTLSACAPAPAKPDANYAAYLELIQTQQTAEDALINGIAATASACTDSRCVEHVAAVAALAASGGRNRPSPQMHRTEPSLGRQVALALVGQIAPLASAAVNWHQSDNNRREAEAQYSYMGSVLTTALSGMSSVAIGATPSINVGGNYGDTYGDNFTGRDRSETNVDGPQINGNSNVIGDRNYNAGRQDSAGPYEPAEPPDPGGP